MKTLIGALFIGALAGGIPSLAIAAGTNQGDTKAPVAASGDKATSGPESRSGWCEFRNGGQSSATGHLPLKWTPESIHWQSELPGYGQSAPIIFGQSVIVTSVEGPMKDECLVSCLELATGKSLWTYRQPASAKAASNYMASRAAPTPMVDRNGVFAFFESGDLVAVDHSGKLVWNRSLSSEYGAFDNNHGLGSSPTQTDSLVILNVEHKGPSYLIAIDKSNGKTVWKTDRKSSSSWSSPIVLSAETNKQVIVSSGGAITAYAADTGVPIWNVEGLDGNSVPSPTFADESLYIGARAPEFGTDSDASRSNLCLDLSQAESANPKVKWRASKAISDYASPVVCGNWVYFLNKSGILYCLDRNSGEVQYTERLGTQCWATPIVAEDRIYFFGKDGKTQVIRSGPKFDVVSSNLLWDPQAPPKPEHYTEHVDSARAHGGEGGGRGAGMFSNLKKADVDGDGVLSASEIPNDFKPMLARIDTNGDGKLDQAEMKTMADSFAARRSDSRDSARDPIVYGAAAVDGALVIRTGTRLYCLH